MLPLSHRQHEVKKIQEDCKPVAGRIADKISLFERSAGGVTKQPVQTPRSADASPVRKAHQRLKASFSVSDQRSRPIDHDHKARSSSASPCRDRLMPIKERLGTFMAKSEKRDAAAPPPHSAMTGMSPQTPTCVTSGAAKSAGQDSQGKLDAKEQTQRNTKSEIALKPDGPEAVPAGVKITIPLNQPTVDKTVASKTEDQSAAKEAGAAAEGPDEMTKSPESKGPSRTTSRSKRRKSKELTNSTTPHGEHTTINQDRDTAVFVKRTEERQGSSLDEQPQKNIEGQEKEEEHSSILKENAERQEPEPSVNKDEPDMAACATGTKTCIDKETGGNDVFATQEEGEASKASREPPASSSILRAINQEQESPVQSSLDKVPSEEQHAGKIMEPISNDVENTEEPHKDIKLIGHSQNEGTGTSDTSSQANQTEKTQNETLQQLLTSLDEVQSTAERRGSGATDDDSKHAEEPQRIRDETKSDRLKPTAQKDRETETIQSRGAKAAGRSEGDRKPLEAEKRPPAESTERTGSTTESAAKTAEKQPHSVLVEQMDNSPSESRRHGANDVVLPAEKPTTASEKVTVEADPVALPLMTARAGDSSVKGSALVSASKSKEAAGPIDEKNASVITSGPFEGKIPEEVIVPPGPLRKADALKGVGKMEPKLAGSYLTENSKANELSAVANGDISQQPLPLTVKAEAVDNKPGLSPNLPASPEANISGSAQCSPKKKLNFSWGMSKEDSDRQQDAPSSWLDVDFPKQRLRVSAPKLNSSGSESNLLDTSGEFDEDDFVENIKKLCAPFSLPPRKHNPLRPPQPPFALPAIKEDRFEKTFDPEEFKIGLRKSKYTLETPTSTLNKLHNVESKPGQKPFRASLSDRSILLSSLDTQSRLKSPINDEEQVPEEKDEKVKVKSRLEGSCVLSSLTSSLLKGKRNGVQTQAEGPNSGEVSPSNVPQASSPTLCQPPPPPSPTAAQRSPGLSQREEAPAPLHDSGPPFPSFTDIKLPNYLEKYLPQEARKPALDVQEQEKLQNKVSLVETIQIEKLPVLRKSSGAKQSKCWLYLGHFWCQVIGKMSIQQAAAETEAPVQTIPGIPHATSPSFPGKVPLTHHMLTDHQDLISVSGQHTHF